MRWEGEKPWWFTKRWKARIPKEMLKGIDRAGARNSSAKEQSEEAKFRKAIGDATPWSLDATSLSTWFEDNLHIIAPLPGESIDKAVFGTMTKCDAFLAMATRDYGADTGNTASTHHELQTWRKEYEPKGKPLIPLRMVRKRSPFLFRSMC